MASKTPFADYNGKMQEIASGDIIPISKLATGTPTGTKFIRDDGTLAVPAGGGSGIPYTEVTGTSQALVVNNGYIMNNASLVTGTIPVTFAVGDLFFIDGKGAGGWKIAQNSGQSIRFLDTVTLTGTGGYLSSNNSRDCISLIGTVANTELEVFNSVGNITVNVS